VFQYAVDLEKSTARSGGCYLAGRHAAYDPSTVYGLSDR
jgi:hypothetical protein